MARNHYITPTVPAQASYTVRLGADTSSGFTDADQGKFVKFSVESGFILASAGDPIEGIVTSVDSATQNGWTIGGVNLGFPACYVTFDGLEATPGTGTVALGDYVVVGSVTARNTAMSGYPKVCKATNQPDEAVVSTLAGADTAAAVKTVLDAALVKVADAAANSLYAYRVVSLGSAGTGAVGTTGVIMRMS